MDLQLAGKRALVTGSSSGIGSEIARMLAAEGIGVVVHGRNAERTQAVVRQIEDAGGRAAIALGDLMTEDGKAAVIDATGRAFGGVDILVNNAGGSSSDAARTWFGTTGEEWTAIGRTPCQRSLSLRHSCPGCGSVVGVAAFRYPRATPSPLMPNSAPMVRRRRRSTI